MAQGLQPQDNRDPTYHVAYSQTGLAYGNFLDAVNGHVLRIMSPTANSMASLREWQSVTARQADSWIALTNSDTYRRAAALPRIIRL